MKKIDQLHGALGEVNRQIVQLNKRKVALLKSTVEAQKATATSFPGESYVRYLRSLEARQTATPSPKVVYQGEPGAYSEMATIDFFGKEVDSNGLFQFKDTFEALKNHEADYAVLPIENSSTGAIRQVYDLLMQYNFYIIGETTVAIDHNLMALPESNFNDIKTVYSHEQGLFQCEGYLNNHPEWKKVPQADTAGSAKLVAKLGDPSKAAICSSLAAEIYGLKILERSIHSNSTNTTRFVVVSPNIELRDDRDKICISLTTSHESGSLHDILTVFSVHNINMVRLESRPIPEHNWEYMFFIEFNGDLMQKGMDEVIHELALSATDLRVLGNFKANLIN